VADLFSQEIEWPVVLAPEPLAQSDQHSRAHEELTALAELSVVSRPVLVGACFTKAGPSQIASEPISTARSARHVSAQSMTPTSRQPVESTRKCSQVEVGMTWAPFTSDPGELTPCDQVLDRVNQIVDN